jgi:hypothetical protein
LRHQFALLAAASVILLAGNWSSFFMVPRGWCRKPNQHFLGNRLLLPTTNLLSSLAVSFFTRHLLVVVCHSFSANLHWHHLIPHWRFAISFLL